jgi:hypothetical protein
VVVPVVVAELLDWANAGVARPESISRAVAVFVTSFMFFSSKSARRPIEAGSHDDGQIRIRSKQMFNT